MADEFKSAAETEKFDLASATWARPAEIKTYHKQPYARISPSKTFDGKGKTVLVTAGATGIGYAISESFAQAGVEHLVIIQRRQEVLDKAKKEINAKYPNTKITTYAASVTDYDRITEILKEVGKIDVVVPNAAAGHANVATKDITTADVANTFETNVVSPFHLIKEFLALPSAGPRTVVYVSSGAGQIVQPHNAAYGASKAAANQLIQQFANDHVGTDVTFQTFHPGVIYTELAAKFVPEAAFNWEDPYLPGNFAVWLASDEAKFLAGKFVWAQWDVDELLSLKPRFAENPMLLTTTVIL
ncbi:hypothetical protein LTR36_005150 [Oleoguttula mirabilis]|uniref:Ketoreductase domain-containing protein n=1 Tax=Oleoguttula mirabilis TaxID=1507867 RepID=A0AAV9JVU1_9PEZI|nr:hypothetical protein LTR36_005150 [Oleoguttula mirabilis]